MRESAQAERPGIGRRTTFRAAPKIEVNAYQHSQENADGSVGVYFGRKSPWEFAEARERAVVRHETAFGILTPPSLQRRPA